MKDIGYVTLLQMILTYGNVNQQELTYSLGVDKTIVNRYVHGKLPLKKALRLNEFQQRLFVEGTKIETGQVVLNNKLCEDFYNCLMHHGFAIDEKIKNCYKKRDEEGGKKAFIQALIEAADKSREKGINGDGIDKLNSVEETGVSLQSDDISIESLNFFIGREDMLKEIETKLDAHAFAIICGIGGMGKSKCAQKYAFEGLKSKKYERVQQLYFETDLTTTMLGLRFCQNDDQYENDEEHLEANLRLLSKIDKSNLLIIDNFDAQPNNEDKAILKRLKELKIHVLITTRNMKMDKEDYIIMISPLSDSEQMSLFERHYGSLKESSKPGMSKIFQLTEGHTMLIELVAKTMRDNVMSTEEMFESLNDANDGDMGEISIDKDNEYENDRIYSYIAKLFDSSKIDEEGKKLLIQLTLSGVAGLRLRVLKKLGQDIKVVQNLVNQSWIIRESKSSPMDDRVHLHTAIRTAVLGSAKPKLSDLKEYIAVVVAACNNKFDEEYSKEDKHNLRNIVKNAGDKFLNEYTVKEADLLKTQAAVLKDANESKASLESALSFYQKCIDLFKKNSATSKSNQAVPLAGLYVDCGDVSAQLSDYMHAIQYYRSGIELFTKGKDYSGKAVAYNKLANFYRKASKYEEAKEAFSMAEEIVKEYELDDLFLKAEILNNMGILYLNLRDYNKALNYYYDAMHIRENLNKSERRDKAIAYSYQNIGTAYQKKGDFENAIKWHEKALNLRKEVYGPNHQILSDSLNMLGNDITELVHYTNGRCSYSYNDAKENLDKALDLREKQLGSMHTSVAWSYQSHGIWHFYQGHTEEAISCFNKCLQIRQDKLGSNHAYTAEAFYWLGVANEKTEKEQAINFLRKAESIQKSLKLDSALKQTRSQLRKLK